MAKVALSKGKVRSPRCSDGRDESTQEQDRRRVVTGEIVCVHSPTKELLLRWLESNQVWMHETFLVSDQTKILATSLVTDEEHKEQSLGFDGIKPNDVASVEYQPLKGRSLALSIKRLSSSDSETETRDRATIPEEEDFRPVPLSAAEEAFCTSMLEVAARMSSYLPCDKGN